MKLSDQIIKSLAEHPDEWNADRFHLTNKLRNVSLWIANGAFGMHALDNSSDPAMEVEFGFWERRRLWKAVGQWKEYAVSKLLSGKFTDEKPS